MLSIETFEVSTVRAKLFAKTVDNYKADLEQFKLFFGKLKADLSWKDVDGDIIRDWIENMMDKGNAPSSVNRRLSALRSYYRYALKRGFVESDPTYNIQGPKNKKVLPQFLKETEMDRLIDPRMWTDKYKDVLARTIIITFYSTGVRVSELVGLNLEDVNFVTHELKVTGKRNKQRIIPFGTELEETLMTYLQNRNPKNGNAKCSIHNRKRKTSNHKSSKNNGESEYSKSLNVKEKIATRAATHIRNSNVKS